MIKESKTFTTSDGKEYKSKKSVERHENELTATQMGFEKKEVDTWVVKLSESNRVIKSLLDVKPDWRDWVTHQVKQLIPMIKEAKEDIVTYKLIENLWNREEKILNTIKTKRILDEKPPKEFLDKVEELSKGSTDGTKYELVIHENLPRIIKYKIVEITLSIEEKLERGLELSSEDIEELTFEFPQVYEEEGENRRWSKSILTVVKVEGLGLYAIAWEKGLTEYQENSFYEQPEKVELREKEVVTKVTEVICIDSTQKMEELNNG